MVSKVVDPSKHLAGESSGMVTTACGFSPACGWAQGTHRYKRGQMGDVGCNLNIEKMVKQQRIEFVLGVVFKSLRDEYRPHPDYFEIVQVRDDFSKLRSLVVGDAG